MELPNYDDKRAGKLIHAIYGGDVTLYTLPVELYKQTSEVLIEAMYKGYGSDIKEFDFGTPDYELLRQLRTNIYMFGAAKTFTQVKDITGMMYKDNELVEYSKFKKSALERFKTYNQSYLEAEYTTAITSANSAQNWEYAVENIKLFPRFKSVAIVDSNTTAECMRMNGIIADVKDPIWNHNTPPRHWKCRCYLELLDKTDEQTSTGETKKRNVMERNDKDMQEIFKMNPGRQKMIFSDKHPYFQIEPKYKSWARRNFGLIIPKLKND